MDPYNRESGQFKVKNKTKIFSFQKICATFQKCTICQIFIAEALCTLHLHTTIGDCGGGGLEQVLKSVLTLHFARDANCWFPNHKT